MLKGIAQHNKVHAKRSIHDIEDVLILNIIHRWESQSRKTIMQSEEEKFKEREISQQWREKKIQ